MLKGHTASKHSLAEACVHYARGLQQIEMVGWSILCFVQYEEFFISLMRIICHIQSHDQAKKEGNVDDGHIRDALLPLYLNLSAANLMLEVGDGDDLYAYLCFTAFV